MCLEHSVTVKWEMPAVLDILEGWVDFSNLVKLLMKLDTLSPLFLKVFVVCVGAETVVPFNLRDMPYVPDVIQLCVIVVCLLTTGVLITENQYLFRHSLNEST